MGSIDLFVIAKDQKAMATLNQSYNDHIQWSAGSHLLEPDKLTTFGEHRKKAIQRFDQDQDGKLNRSERASAENFLSGR
jgi:hypothetical protein